MADVQLCLRQGDDGQWHVAPQEKPGHRIEDMSWPVPPGNARPPGMPGRGGAVDDLKIVDPERIVDALIDYQITDAWCAKDGSRIMLKLEGLELPGITLSIDPAHTNCASLPWKCGECGNQGSPWVVALVDPV